MAAPLRARRAVALGWSSWPHTFTLDEARERARRARQLPHDHIDPLVAKQAERTTAALDAARAVTFADCAGQYYDAHEAGWTNAKWRQQFLNTMRDDVHPVIGTLPVAAVDEPLVLKVLSPIWKEKTATARRVRNRVAAVLDFAAAAGYRKGTNPARWEGHLEHLLGGTRQDRRHQAPRGHALQRGRRLPRRATPA